MSNIRASYTNGILLFKDVLWNPGDGFVGPTWMEHAKYVDIDLTNKCGAHIFISVGRRLIDANANTDNGSFFEVRRIIKDVNGDIMDHPIGIQYRSSTIPVSSQTIVEGDMGTNMIILDANANLFPIDTYVYFEYPDDDPFNPDYPYYGVARVIDNNGTDTLIIDAPLQSNRSGQTIYNYADVFPPIEVRGGAIYRIAMTYGIGQLAESTHAVRVMAQTYDYDLSEEA